MPVLDLFRLDGKTTLVTGAASGIGRAICHAMAEAGADVACVDRNATGAQQTAADVEARGRRALALTADVADAEQVAAAVGEAVRTFGVLDIVCANAGIVGRAGATPLGEILPE